MAYTSSIDELNNLQTEQDKQKIRAYFEEMDLEPEEIEKRIGVANDLDNLYLILFLLMTASVAAGENVIDQNAYWNDYLTRGYNDVLTENGYDTDDPMVSNRIDETVAEVLNTTYEHIAQTYYLSHDRALMIASNDTNAFANYEQHIQAIKAGYTRKRWMAMKDKKVRHTHVWADGQEVDIQMPFIVGGYEMLFPLDQSLGADAKEVVNCRCVCQYFDLRRSFYTTDDPLREALGSALENNSERTDEILTDLKNSNCEIEFRPNDMCYQPSLYVGKAGKFVIDKDASIGAWEHEYRHFLDDRAGGYPSFRVFQNKAKCRQMEYDAYQVEIDIAEKIGRIDLKKRLIALRDKELKKYE